MSKVKNITLNGKKIGDYSKNELSRITLQVVTDLQKFQQTAKLLFLANKKLKAQNEYFKRMLR